MISQNQRTYGAPVLGSIFESLVCTISDECVVFVGSIQLFLFQSSLRGHKNIVQYVDHLIMKNKNGIYDCMLLTAYYKCEYFSVSFIIRQV